MKTALLTDDPKQALRIKRLFMSFASYLMCMGLVLYCDYRGWFLMPPGGTLWFLATVLFVNAGFYLVFRTGWNLRFSDSSLTMAQMVAAFLVLMVVIYYAGRVRGVMLLLYLITYVFGVFRLRVHQFFFLTVVSLASYALVIWLLVLNRPEAVDLQVEIMHWIVLAVVLPWFSLVGGYISQLRTTISKANSELSEALSTIEVLAIHDELTQVYNRRHMLDLLQKEKARADRHAPHFCLGIVDLDHFKNVNDRFGHLVGDTVLRTLVRDIGLEIREADFLARYGGEEFVMVLADTDLAGALRVAERMRKRAENCPYPGLPEDFRVTISIGLTEYVPVESIEMVLARADSALYQAKHRGRNQVVQQLKPDQPKAAVRSSSARPY